MQELSRTSQNYLAEHFSYQGVDQGTGCGICQIPENGSRHAQTQVLQETRMNLF